MTWILVFALVMAYLLLATAWFTKVNKAAVAMFLATFAWVLYICFGTDFVMQNTPDEYMRFLNGNEATSETVKYFIFNHTFLRVVGKAASVVMFLIATMSIIEILENNGCLEFISRWIRTRNSKRILWTITLATFILSANLDNVTTTMTMLVIMHGIVQNRRQRMVVGTAILLAANLGGCFTVIGDPGNLVMWNNGAITASRFSFYMFLPALVAWVVPTWLLGRMLPERIDVEWPRMQYRGDDTNLNYWQRMMMLFVGIGGLWFIPTFHNITKLSPFLGALCVLSVLWVINEIFNRKLYAADQMASRRKPRSMEYGNMQMILLIMGIMLGFGVGEETGIFKAMATIADNYIHNVWIVGLITGLMSGVIDSFTMAMTNISMYPVLSEAAVAASSDPGYFTAFATNGIFWSISAFCIAVGGCLFCFASPSGIALISIEKVPLGWYLRNCTPKILTGAVCGIVTLTLEHYLITL